MLEMLRRDIVFAWRNLRRTPVLAAVAVLSIALGIAATTSVFSVVDAALFRPPPLDAAERLAIVLSTREESWKPVSMQRWSWPRSFSRSRRRSFPPVTPAAPMRASSPGLSTIEINRCRAVNDADE